MNSGEKPKLEQAIVHGLSDIKKTPNGTSLAYSSLTNLGLSDLKPFSPFIYIQQLNLSGNLIQDLNPLSSMTFLARLCVSNNRIADIEHWKRIPKFLEELDISRNCLSSISTISRVKYLQHLCVDDNMLFDLADLAKCSHLKTLSAAKNNIVSLNQLKGLKIIHLNISKNNISSLRDLPCLDNLQELLLSGNILLDLVGIQPKTHRNLKYLDISFNEIEEPKELHRLQPLVLLSNLNTLGNPFIELVQKVPSKFEERCFIKNAEYTLNEKYRFWMVFTLNQLDVLDGLPLSSKDLVRATNYFDPPLQVISSAQHGHLVKQQVKLQAKIRQKSKLVGSIVAPFVISGKKGSGKRTITKRLVETHDLKFQHGISYTTRPPMPSEKHGREYYFVSDEELMSMFSNGELLEIFQSKGFKYAFKLDLIDEISEQGKVCLLNMEFQGAITLQKAHIKPKLIYIHSPTEVDEEIDQIEKLLSGLDYSIVLKGDWEQMYTEIEEIALAHFKKARIDAGFPDY